jgi:hypothetical protein
MSHFTVLVIGPDWEEQLAPYDENESVEPYKAYWDSHEIEMHERYLLEQGRISEGATLEEVVEAYNALYEYEDEDRAHMDDGGAYQWSQYNPKSKWDWYEVGGRWRGYFKLQNNAWSGSRFRKKAKRASLGKPGVFNNAPLHDADIALKGEVAIDQMRDEAGARAGEVWDRVHAVIGDLPEVIGWEDHVGRIKLAEAGDGEYTIEQARKDYHEQPGVRALKEWNESLPNGEKVIGFFGPGAEDFQVSREEFVQEARDNALCPFAYVMDGEWHEPGKMGWFGASSDTKSDRVRFAREFNELLDSLPDDAELTLVDCHI